MKILVISDTHGNFAQAFRAHQQAGGVDRIVHLGDGADDARLLEEVLEVPVVAVAGNCDLGSRLPHECLIRFGTTLFFLTHGNRYHVKGGLALLKRKAAEVGATVVLYGHTHLPKVEWCDGTLLVNPGELKGETGSYAIVTLANGGASAEIFPLE